MIAENIGNKFFFEWEVSLGVWLQQNIPHDSVPGFLLDGISMVGIYLPLFLVLALYWGFNKKLGRFIGLNILMADISCSMIKNIFLRLRPYLVTEKLVLYRKIAANADANNIAAQGFSFPSGHSTDAAAMSMSLVSRFKKRKWLIAAAVLFPLFVGISRVYVAAHFPTDVMTGWVLGITMALLLPVVRRAVKSDLLFYGIILLYILPGIFYCASEDYFTTLGLILGYISSDLFEKRFVNFEDTTHVGYGLLRTVAGFGAFAVLNVLMKLPFSEEFLDNGTLAAHLVRTGRYAVSMFLILGVYPMAFRYTDRFFKKPGRSLP